MYPPYQQPTSRTHHLVLQACDPSLPEPAYDRNLTLADYINDKKANTPREAAMAVVAEVNSRNQHVGVLALHLLDTLVKNCGYPFQLQIATKEFLNELVRKFPERPPVFPGVVMTKTLELIHEWKATICAHSKWKEDLVHVRDMHRLLSYKGYRFRELRGASTLQTTETENLKTPHELEEEDRQAKSAKLQELIRRGTPKDLLKAQELMKDLSGFEPDQQPNYEEQTSRELDKVQSKAILLNDMLNNAEEGKKIGVDGDEYSQVALSVKQARPKIQKWISEVSEEAPDSLDRLLLMNDLINGVLERYEECKQGNWDKGRGVDISQYTAPPPAEPSLISFDAFADSPPAASIALPTTINHDRSTSSTSSSTAAASGSTTLLGGLPADLFSAPSPSPTPANDFFSSPVGAPQQAGGVKKPIDLSGLYSQGFGQRPSGASTPSAFPGSASAAPGGVWGQPSAAQGQLGAFGQPLQHQQQQQQQRSPFDFGSSTNNNGSAPPAAGGQKKADPFDFLL